MKHFKSTIHLSFLLAHARFARKAEAFSNCAIVYTVPKKIQEVVEFIDVNFHDTNKLCMYKSSSYHREKDHKEKVTLELYFFRTGYIQYAKQMRKFRVTEYTRNHDIAFLVFLLSSSLSSLILMLISFIIIIIIIIILIIITIVIIIIMFCSTNIRALIYLYVSKFVSFVYLLVVG